MILCDNYQNHGEVTMINQALAVVYAMQQNLLWVLMWMGLLWAINIVNWLVGSWLNILGLYPRSLFGLVGVVCSPILHGNFNHLFFNSVPLFVFANLILLYGKPVFFCVTILVVLISGGLVWIFGRKAIHIGASGVVMGYWSYLLINAVREQTAMALILGAVSIFYFGGLFLSLFASDEGVSLEGHVAGFIGGIAAYFLCHNSAVVESLGTAMAYLGA